MRIPSGVTDQYIYFVAVDSTDLTTRETGITGWTVYRSRNGGAAAAMTTPTINETDATNMPGIYELLLDEDMTIDAGDQSQEMIFHITATGVAPITRTIELYRPSVTAGETLTVASGVARANDSSGNAVASASALATVDTVVDAILVDTDTTIPGLLATIDTNVDSILADTSTDGVAIGASTLNSIADAVWDEATSGHVTSGSFGQAFATARSGTAQAGAATTITLDASASAVDDFYNNALVKITGGTGAGQSRFITDYNGTTKVATVSTWGVNPSTDSVFVITGFDAIVGATAPTASEVADAVWDEARADHTSSGSFGQSVGGVVVRAATAQAGTTTTITLDASASATNDLYNYNQIYIISGTGAGQSRQITDYVGASKVATVGVPFTTAPSSDSVFLILPLGVDAATVASIADAVWDEARADHTTAGSFGEYTNADAVRISGDATAANNCESFFDGTGYAGTNNVIPSVTTVTGNVNGNVGGNVTGSVGSVTGAVGSVTGNVGGNVTGSVGSVVGNVGGNVVGSVASVTADVGVTAASVRTAVGMASANLDTQLSTIDTVADGIKAKTDSLTFTTAGIVDANVERVVGIDLATAGTGGQLIGAS